MQDSDRVGEVESAGREREGVEIGLDQLHLVADALPGGVDGLGKIGSDDPGSSPSASVLREPSKTAARVEHDFSLEVPLRQRHNPIAPLSLRVRVLLRIVAPGIAKGRGGPSLPRIETLLPHETGDSTHDREAVVLATDESRIPSLELGAAYRTPKRFEQRLWDGGSGQGGATLDGLVG